jgi:hypothetical protein
MRSKPAMRWLLQVCYTADIGKLPHTIILA